MWFSHHHKRPFNIVYSIIAKIGALKSYRVAGAKERLDEWHLQGVICQHRHKLSIRCYAFGEGVGVTELSSREIYRRNSLGGAGLPRPIDFARPNFETGATQDN